MVVDGLVQLGVSTGMNGLLVTEILCLCCRSTISPDQSNAHESGEGAGTSKGFCIWMAWLTPKKGLPTRHYPQIGFLRGKFQLLVLYNETWKESCKYLWLPSSCSYSRPFVLLQQYPENWITGFNPGFNILISLDCGAKNFLMSSQAMRVITLPVDVLKDLK